MCHCIASNSADEAPSNVANGPLFAAGRVAASADHLFGAITVVGCTSGCAFGTEVADWTVSVFFVCF